MELLPIVRAIWRRRLALVAIPLALAVFVALGGTTPVSTPNAVAWTGVTLDTPQSQLVAVAPPGAITLVWRASLLTHLMTTSTATQALARRVGVGADQVSVVDPALATPLVSTAMAQAASTAASRDVAPYTLTVFVANDSLPVISIEAAAPDRQGAQRLADAAVTVLQSQASTGGTFTSQIATGGKVFARQPFVIDQVAPVRVKELPVTALPIKAIGVSFLGLLAWCGGWCAGVLLLRWWQALQGRRAALPA